MVLFSPFSLLSFLALTLVLAQAQAQTDLIFTVVNNCPYTIWPAIQPNSGFPVLERGGFALQTVTHRSFRAPTTHWSGRIWGRTGCTYTDGHFKCTTGDCGGRLECDGLGGTAPATLAQFSVHHGHKDQSSYGVSLVDGFNLPMTVTPHEGRGECPVVGCKHNLLLSCPDQLKLKSPAGHGPVVACMSGCEALKRDDLCCTGRFNSPETCKPTSYSDFFKHACPATFTYAHDSPSLTHNCAYPRELKVIFCH